MNKYEEIVESLYDELDIDTKDMLEDKIALFHLTNNNKNMVFLGTVLREHLAKFEDEEYDTFYSECWSYWAGFEYGIIEKSDKLLSILSLKYKKNFLEAEKELGEVIGLYYRHRSNKIITIRTHEKLSYEWSVKLLMYVITLCIGKRIINEIEEIGVWVSYYYYTILEHITLDELSF